MIGSPAICGGAQHPKTPPLSDRIVLVSDQTETRVEDKMGQQCRVSRTLNSSSTHVIGGPQAGQASCFPTDSNCSSGLCIPTKRTPGWDHILALSCRLKLSLLIITTPKKNFTNPPDAPGLLSNQTGSSITAGIIVEQLLFTPQSCPCSPRSPPEPR